MPGSRQSWALQQTPLAHEPSLQLTVQVAPPQLISAGQLLAAHAMFVSLLSPLSSKFWQACVPLHSNKHELAPLQLSLLGQLFSPLQRIAQLSASQRTSFLQAPFAPHTTSHEPPPQRMLPEHVFSSLHCTEQLVAF